VRPEGLGKFKKSPHRVSNPRSSKQLRKLHSMSACVTMFMTLSDFSWLLKVTFMSLVNILFNKSHLCHWLIYFLTLFCISYDQFCLLKQSYSTLNRIFTLQIRVHLFLHKTDCQLYVHFTVTDSFQAHLHSCRLLIKMNLSLHLYT
jgi:hypothetical protein